MATLAVCACPSRRPLIDLRSTGSIDSHQRSRSPRSMSRLRSCRQRPIVALHPLERRRARIGWSEKKLPTPHPCCPFRRQDARAGQFSQYVMRQERRSDQRFLNQRVPGSSPSRHVIGIDALDFALATTQSAVLAFCRDCRERPAIGGVFYIRSN